MLSKRSPFSSCRSPPESSPSQLSKVPLDNFADTLEEQEKQLAANPLLLRFQASRKLLTSDPNGLSFWKGRWDLFYQAYPPEDRRLHWGTASSTGATCRWPSIQIPKRRCSPALPSSRRTASSRCITGSAPAPWLRRRTIHCRHILSSIQAFGSRAACTTRSRRECKPFPAGSASRPISYTAPRISKSGNPGDRQYAVALERSHRVSPPHYRRRELFVQELAHMRAAMANTLPARIGVSRQPSAQPAELRAFPI